MLLHQAFFCKTIFSKGKQIQLAPKNNMLEMVKIQRKKAKELTKRSPRGSNSNARKLPKEVREIALILSQSVKQEYNTKGRIITIDSL